MLVGSQRRGIVRAVWSMCSGTEARRLIDGGRSSDGGRVRGEALECLGNDTWGRHTDFTSDFVDSNGKAEILDGISFNRERVVQLEATDEVIGAGGILELDTEVIDDQSESHAVGGVAEDTGCASLQVTMSG